MVACAVVGDSQVERKYIQDLHWRNNLLALLMN